MSSRTIYIGTPAYIKLKDEQMLIIEPKTKETKGRIPTEDMGLLVLDHYQITLSHQIIQKLMHHNVSIISCDSSHHPKGVMYPLYGHTLYSERCKYQLDASEALKKQLWKQTVEAKIDNQKELLISRNEFHEPMEKYRTQVKSGDHSNREGIAAQHYWKHLISSDFLRERYGASPNPFFNFGYSILRAMIARAIVETGLLPVQGIFHHNKYNAFCLADDLMEPYRPLVDERVMHWIDLHPQAEELNIDFKKHILNIATQDVRIGSYTRPMMVAIKSTTVSLYHCFTGEKRKILYPKRI